MVHYYLAAAGGSDLFSIGNQLVTRLGGLLGLILVLFIGAKALGHIAQDRFGLAIGVALIALIPAAFIFDPSGVEATLKATVKSLGG